MVGPGAISAQSSRMKNSLINCARRPDTWRRRGPRHRARPDRRRPRRTARPRRCCADHIRPASARAPVDPRQSGGCSRSIKRSNGRLGSRRQRIICARSLRQLSSRCRAIHRWLRLSWLTLLNRVPPEFVTHLQHMLGLQVLDDYAARGRDRAARYRGRSKFASPHMSEA